MVGPVGIPPANVSIIYRILKRVYKNTRVEFVVQSSTDNGSTWVDVEPFKLIEEARNRITYLKGNLIDTETSVS